MPNNFHNHLRLETAHPCPAMRAVFKKFQAEITAISRIEDFDMREDQYCYVVDLYFTTFDSPPVEVYKRIEAYMNAENSVTTILEAHATWTTENEGSDNRHCWLFDGDKSKVIETNLKDSKEEVIKVQEVSSSDLDKIKGECLAKYVQRKPTRFFQVDCYGLAHAGRREFDPYVHEVDMSFSSTWELMHGAPVRILIGDRFTDREVLADMVIRAAEVVRNDSELLKEHHARDWAELEDSIELPF